MAKLSDLAEMFCYGATKQPQNGDVAVIRVGANAGTKIIAVTNDNVATITKNYIGVRCKDSAIAKKVFEALTSEECKNAIIALRHGAAQPAITLADFKNVEVDL